MSLFTFDDVTVQASGRTILESIELEIPARGITVVVGPSGAGKTTLLRLCNRLEVPTSGQVLLDGVDVATLDPRRLRRRVGMVFQRPTLFPGTVRDNLRVAAPSAPDDSYRDALSRAEIDPGFLDRDAGELSGGEGQRVCLARAMVASPEVLLMDEPTSALDRGPRLRLEALVRRLADAGMPIVWVTHQLDQMQRLANHVVVVKEGRLRFAGDVGDLDRVTDVELAELVRDDPDAG